MKKFRKYTDPIEVDRSGDLTKEWYVEFYFEHPTKKKFVRVRRTLEINREKTLKARRFALKLARQAFQEMLENGWSPFEDAEKNLDLMVNLQLAIKIEDIFKETLALKKRQVSPRSYEGYEDIANQFAEWLRARQADIADDLSLLDSAVIYKYSRYLALERKNKKTNLIGLGNKTINHHIGMLNSLFNDIRKEHKKLLPENPCKDFEMLKLGDRTKHLAFNYSVRNTLLSHFKKHDPQLALASELIYYTALRSNEERLLQVKDFNLQRYTISIDKSKIINGEEVRWAKNGKRRTIAIPASFMRKIEALELHKYPGDYFILGYNMDKPQDWKNIVRGIGPYCYGRNTLAERFRNIRRSLGLDEQYTLYSWKHTAADDLFEESSIPVQAISDHFRHHSISQTEEYARTRGHRINTDLVLHYPSIIPTKDTL